MEQYKVMIWLNKSKQENV